MLLKYAPMAELADAPDLGSGVPDVKVQVLFGAPYRNNTNLDKSRFVFSLQKIILECKYFGRITKEWDINSHPNL